MVSRAKKVIYEWFPAQKSGHWSRNTGRGKQWLMFVLKQLTLKDCRLPSWFIGCCLPTTTMPESLSLSWGDLKSSQRIIGVQSSVSWLKRCWESSLLCLLPLLPLPLLLSLSFPRAGSVFDPSFDSGLWGGLSSYLPTSKTLLRRANSNTHSFYQ